jgi:hypothetical protein
MFSLGDLKKIFEQKGYKFFDKGVYNLNIIGVRSENSQSNEFDDWLLLVYKEDVLDDWVIKQYPITTDPGKYYLMNPLNKDGTIILVPGQYRGVYAIGIHGRSFLSGGYEAMEQIAPMAYVRDNSRDSKLDFDLYKNPKNIFWDNPKTNIHRASKNSIVRWVEKYSAGCQVFQNPKHFEEFLSTAKKARQIWGNKFSYTLLEEKDFK